MTEQFVSTIQLCEEIGLRLDTLNKLRTDGVLIEDVTSTGAMAEGRRFFDR